MKNLILIKYLILIISVISLIENKPDLGRASDCLIKNIEYKDEFLYTCHELDISNNYKRKVYTNPVNLNYMRSFDQLRWTFVPIAGMNDTFYIVNSRYNEHLCASNIHLDVFNFRRKVNTVNLSGTKKSSESVVFNSNPTSLLNSNNNKKCMWQLEQVEKGLNRFVIRNFYYQEPLYAASSLLKTVRSRRNVYTWHAKPDSKQFVWYIYCFTQEMLSMI